MGLMVQALMKQDSCMEDFNIKNAIKFLLFICLLMGSFIKINDISISKTLNRYYMLKRELESKDGDYDVQVYGSCHAYTSFNSKKFEEKTV